MGRRTHTCAHARAAAARPPAELSRLTESPGDLIKLVKSSDVIRLELAQTSELIKLSADLIKLILTSGCRCLDTNSKSVTFLTPVGYRICLDVP